MVCLCIAFTYVCVCRGEADERPGQLPGDVIFVIQQQEHLVRGVQGTRTHTHLHPSRVCLCVCV